MTHPQRGAGGQRPTRIILHGGLPKAASTALQHWCDHNRAQLRAHGVDYPEVATDGNGSPLTEDHTPKHGFLVNALRKGDMSAVRNAVGNARAPILLMSTEGLSNHFFHFPKEHFAPFREALSVAPVELFMVTRDREKWLRSLWKESVIRTSTTTDSFESFARRPGVQRMSDWNAFRSDLASAYHADMIHEARIEDGWLKGLLSSLNIESEAGFGSPEETRNVSLPDDIIEFVRHLNGLGLPPLLRVMVFHVVQRRFRTGSVMMIDCERWKTPSPAQLREIGVALSRLEALPPAAQQVADAVADEVARMLGMAGA